MDQHFNAFDWAATPPADAFQTKSRASLIEQASGEVFAGCNVLTIRGCRGVGKSHLGHELASLLRAHGIVVVCASGAVHGEAQVQNLVARAQAATCMDVGRSTQRLVLLVDDAKACSAAMFAALWSLVARRSDGGPALQLILLGDVGPWPGLNDPGLADLREASTSCYILVPFEEQEAAAYVRHRFAQAAPKRFGPIGRAALRNMVGHSQGVPALLEALVSEALVSDALVRNGRQHKRDTLPASRPWSDAGSAGRPAIVLGCTAAFAVALAAGAFVRPRTDLPSAAPSSVRLLSSATLRPAQVIAYAGLAPLSVETIPASTADTVPAERGVGKPGPGLVLVAATGDDMRLLYRKVYRGVTPPPFPAVLAANPSHIRPGVLVIFPEPPGGWFAQ